MNENVIIRFQVFNHYSVVTVKTDQRFLITSSIVLRFIMYPIYVISIQLHHLSHICFQVHITNSLILSSSVLNCIRSVQLIVITLLHLITTPNPGSQEAIIVRQNQIVTSHSISLCMTTLSMVSS